MSWRFKGRASVDTDSPKAFGICDRTGFLLNLNDLHWQMEWAGSTLINKRILVREQSLDVPSPFLRTLIIPPDPDPILNARPEQYYVNETDWFSDESGEDRFVTETDEPFVNESNPAPTWDAPDNFPPQSDDIVP